jgi:hypothetical protein
MDLHGTTLGRILHGAPSLRISPWADRNTVIVIHGHRLDFVHGKKRS